MGRRSRPSACPCASAAGTALSSVCGRQQPHGPCGATQTARCRPCRTLSSGAAGAAAPCPRILSRVPSTAAGSAPARSPRVNLLPWRSAWTSGRLHPGTTSPGLSCGRCWHVTLLPSTALLSHAPGHTPCSQARRPTCLARHCDHPLQGDEEAATSQAGGPVATLAPAWRVGACATASAAQQTVSSVGGARVKGGGLWHNQCTAVDARLPLTPTTTAAGHAAERRLRDPPPPAADWQAS